ncbi:nucleotidyltransferase domain-containing protein [Desulfosoma sp.]
MQALKEKIISTFRRFDPEKIILFGSRARGDHDGLSDVDLILVYSTEKRFLDRLEELYLAWDTPVALDLLAYTPEEFNRLLDENPFVQEAVKQGEVLYEKCLERGASVVPPSER